MDQLEPIRFKSCVHSLKDASKFTQMLENFNSFDRFMILSDISSLLQQPLKRNNTNCLHSEILPLPKGQFKELPLLCTIDVQFQLNNIVYSQFDGVVIGGLLSRILIVISVSNIEQTVMCILVNILSLHVHLIYLGHLPI